MKDSFIFYRSFYEAPKYLPDHMRLKVYEMIFELGLNDKTVDEKDETIKALFTLIEPQIIANKKKYEKGLNGGRPTEYDYEEIKKLIANGYTNREISEKIGCSYSTITKLSAKIRKNGISNFNNICNIIEEPNVNKKENVNVNENANYNKNIHANKKSKEITKKKFIKPTLEEVLSYCKERNNKIDAERFIDYYTANGWKVGRNPMKDWKSAVRTWERNDRSFIVNKDQRNGAMPSKVNCNGAVKKSIAPIPDWLDKKILPEKVNEAERMELEALFNEFKP